MCPIVFVLPIMFSENGYNICEVAGGTYARIMGKQSSIGMVIGNAVSSVADSNAVFPVADRHTLLYIRERESNNSQPLMV